MKRTLIFKVNFTRMYQISKTIVFQYILEIIRNKSYQNLWSVQLLKKASQKFI